VEAWHVVRTLRALEMLAVAPRSAPELAAGLLVHVRTARRILTRLEAEGYVYLSDGRRRQYRPTMRIVALAGQVVARAELTQTAVPYVRWLLSAEQTPRRIPQRACLRFVRGKEAAARLRPINGSVRTLRFEETPTGGVMSRMQQVIDVLEAERQELRERLAWVDKQIGEFRDRHNGSTASHPAPRSRRRANARRASTRRATARSLHGDTKAKIVDYLSKHPGSTAGDVAKALNLKRNSTSTRLAQMAKSGELKKAARGYKTA
jgi:DNA-binding MarR family transcriptional regulator